MDRITGSQSGADQTRQTKILVVDDDALNQRMMQLLLGRDGYEVDVVSNGSDAIEAIKREKYNLVFMDLQMPVMGGIETSRRIREWENGNRHTYIVALTASYLPEMGQELFEAGIDNYVAKPFEVEHIRRLLKYSLIAPAMDSHQPPGFMEAPPVTAVLDLQKGIAHAGGDPAAYRELLDEFVQGLPERLQSIQRAFSARDLETLSRAAHNLNGVAASLGALQLSAYARKLDKESVGGYTEAIRHLVGEMQITGMKLMETSKDFLSKDSIGLRSS